jgi:hypothetical protein
LGRIIPFKALLGQKKVFNLLIQVLENQLVKMAILIELNALNKSQHTFCSTDFSNTWMSKLKNFFCDQEE